MICAVHRAELQSGFSSGKWNDLHCRAKYMLFFSWCGKNPKTSYATDVLRLIFHRESATDSGCLLRIGLSRYVFIISAEQTLIWSYWWFFSTSDCSKEWYLSFFPINKHSGHFLCYSQIWHIFIEQENKLPKDLRTHLAEVISKSWGRWCHSQPLHCFRGVLICIHKWQPCLAVRNILCYVYYDWMGLKVFSSCMWGFWWNWLIYHGEPIDWDPRDVFVGGSRGWGETHSKWMGHTPPDTHTNSPTQLPTPNRIPPFAAGIGVWKCWHMEWRAAPETPGILLRRSWVGGWGGALECTQKSQSLIY